MEIEVDIQIGIQIEILIEKIKNETNTRQKSAV